MGGFAAHRTGGFLSWRTQLGGFLPVDAPLPFVRDKTMLIIITKFQKRRTNPPTPTRNLEAEAIEDELK
jgi:hypothetical protein